MSGVVVTGMGVVSPLGAGVPEVWSALCAGTSGIGEITRFDTTGFTLTRGGEVPDSCLVPASVESGPEEADPAVRFMLAAAEEALHDSGLAAQPDWAADTGVVLATNFGGIVAGERVLAHTAGFGDFEACTFQRSADVVAARYALAGPRLVLSLSCSSGAAALGYGCELIRAGRAKAVLTGGYDALSRFAWSGLSALRTMTKDVVRPFDKGRSGTIFSEGAGALLIEAREYAEARGARLYAHVLGYGVNNNAHHLTAPPSDGQGSAAVMRMALADAGLEPDRIDHINAHGTGTPHNDVTETRAIKAVFGAAAYRIPVTSIKSMTGHMMGAAGSVEAIATVLSLRDGVVPPTIHYETPDPDCDLDIVANSARLASMRTALTNSAGIGGCNAAIILSRTDA